MVSKKLLVAIAAASTLGMSLSTVAATACNTGCPGVYIGAQAGWGQVSTKHHQNDRNRKGHHGNLRGDDDNHHGDDNRSSSRSNDGFAGRLYLGYQFNQYFGLESGVAGFFTDSDNHRNNDRNDNHHGGHGGLRGDDDHHGKKGNHHSHDNNLGQWDLLARVGTPFGCSCFRGDLKGGVAYLFNGNSDSDRVIPVAGASVAYSFCQNISVDLSYLHGFGSNGGGNHDNNDHHDHHLRGDDNHKNDRNGHDSLRVKSTDLVTIGVSYLFPTM